MFPFNSFCRDKLIVGGVVFYKHISSFDKYSNFNTPKINVWADRAMFIIGSCPLTFHFGFHS